MAARVKDAQRRIEASVTDGIAKLYLDRLAAHDRDHDTIDGLIAAHAHDREH